MWFKMSSVIKSSAKEVLGEVRGRAPVGKEAWWWNEEVKDAIRTKRESHRNLKNEDDKDRYEKYKVAKKIAKRIISDSKARVHNDVYEKLKTREGEKELYKIAKLRDRKGKDLNGVRCIKSDSGTVLVKNEEIKNRWRDYFDKLFNAEAASEAGDNIIPMEEINRDYKRMICLYEVREALRKLKRNKAAGPNGIPIEIWKRLGEVGIE